MADKLIVGCGYLGRCVAARWLAQGHRVFGTTRSAGRAEELARMGVEPVVCDVISRGSLIDTFRELPQIRTVLYCVGYDRHARHSMHDVYRTGLHNFVEYAPQWLKERFLYVSSTGVYGQMTGEEVDEEAATVPSEQSGRIVLSAEEYLESWYLELPLVRLRFTGIYGPGRVIRRQAIEAGEPIIGDADKWLNLIHVEDGATAVLAAEEKGQIGAVYNVSDDHPVRRRDYYTELARLLGAPEPRFVLPEPGAPLPNHERANRRVVNRRMHEELGVTLRYPSYREGLPAAITPVS